MGSMLKVDSDRRRAGARAPAGEDGAQAAAPTRLASASTRRSSATPPAPSAMQRAAQERVDAALDRIVTEALDRHDQRTATATRTPPRQHRTGNAHDRRASAGAAAARGPGASRRRAHRPGTSGNATARDARGRRQWLEDR